MSNIYIRGLAAAGLAILAMFVCSSARVRAADPPNFIIILCDNLGYGDVGCFGSTKHRTPHIDRLAAEGLKLTSFYVSSGVCTPSRASLMTGCYPRRVNLHESANGGVVLRPVGQRGLHPDEITIAEILKQQGYATACIGKWHLGDQPQFLPTRQGFDRYFGIPYSDDMTERPGQPWPPLPLMEDKDIAPLLTGGDGAESPHEAFYYYQRGQLQAVRGGRWKLHLALPDPRNPNQPGEPALYDVVADLGETTNLAAENPEIVKKLQTYAASAREDLGDEGRPGKNQRQAGHVADPRPQVITPR